MYTNNTEFEQIEGANVTANNGVVTVKGSQGELTKNFGPTTIITVEGSKIKVSAKRKPMLHTVRGIVNNMMVGVTKGYTKKMKILYSHFPITVQPKGAEITIKNFLGEKHPRKSKIQGNTKVTVKGQEITITGCSKEDVGQTAANIRSATKIRDRDERIFQDGIYIVE